MLFYTGDELHSIFKLKASTVGIYSRQQFPYVLGKWNCIIYSLQHVV